VTERDILGGQRKIKLLIVDEQPINVKTLHTLFRQYGYDCAVALTADEALAAIDAHRSEAVVLEWDFRDGSGVGLAARLRARAAVQARDLVVIALSAIDEPEGFREREQVDDYFVKPMSVSLIDRWIRALL
jgi:DNA-binding response OmpR family regulator